LYVEHDMDCIYLEAIMRTPRVSD